MGLTVSQAEANNHLLDSSTSGEALRRRKRPLSKWWRILASFQSPESQTINGSC